MSGVVLDAQTRAPIPGASLVSGTTFARSDDAGVFDMPQLEVPATLSVRAIGYRRSEVPRTGQPVTVALEPFAPKALYLSALGIGNLELRNAALQLISRTELNALVIDVKGDTSLVPWKSAAMTAAGLAQSTRPIVPDMGGLITALRGRGVYLVARVVVFKDEALARAHPTWVVTTSDGGTWVDGKGQAWVDPSRPATWELSLALAEEAAAFGFDEIQFDYLRFPDTEGLHFSKPDTEDHRTAAIGGFLEAARTRLAPFNVFLSADVFGYVCWSEGDLHLGQRLELLAERVDYLSPMLYPSGFATGIPGHRQPLEAPREIVQHTLAEALRRTGLPGVRFRPWLQAFPDYAFDHRVFGAAEIRAQVEAAEGLGSNGWMLWNPHNRYSGAGLIRER